MRVLRCLLVFLMLWGFAAGAASIFGNDLPLPLPDEPGQPPHQEPTPSPPSKPPRCDADYESGSSCTRAVCAQLPYVDCSQASKVKDIACQCRGVNGDCVTAVCNQLDRFDCDERSELLRVVKMCQGVSDATCIDRVCSGLGRFECDDWGDMKKVTDLCRK